jgi:HAD superfamily hydrolase (TIGR01509 family)
MINFVIFDVDGTLVDSVDLHAEAWQRAFEKYGKKVEYQKIRDQIGKGGDQLMPVFFSEKELEDFGEEMEKYRGELFKNEYLDRVKPFPKAHDLIKKVAENRKSVALASSAKPDELEHFKNILDIADYLAGATNADDAEKSKPHPDIFEAALRRLGNPPVEKCVVVGDAPYDAIAARKIGLQTVGILSGGFPEQWLRDEGCVEIYQNPADLLSQYAISLLGRRPDGRDYRATA